MLPPAAAVDESHSGSVVETLRIGNERPRLSSTKFAETRGKLATTWQPLSLCYPCRGETSWREVERRVPAGLEHVEGRPFLAVLLNLRDLTKQHFFQFLRDLGILSAAISGRSALLNANSLLAGLALAVNTAVAIKAHHATWQKGSGPTGVKNLFFQPTGQTLAHASGCSFQNISVMSVMV